MNELPSEIPLFPLPDAALFPQMPLPLHVFEPRYRAMVKDALRGPKIIGMVLLRPGWETDYEGRPAIYDTGCAGLIETSQSLPDGRYNILLRGVTRFRVIEERPGQSYRLAAVEPLADPVGDAAALDGTLDRLMNTVGRATENRLTVDRRPGVAPELLVNAFCQSLSLTGCEKQSLLESPTIEARCQRLLEILEFRLLEKTCGQPTGSSH